jgi:hypothetical protein
MTTTTAASGKNGRTDFAAANLDHSRRVGGCLAKQPEDRAGEVALERTERFQAALASLVFALQVGTRSGVAASLNDRDLVQRRVELTVAVAVESVAALLTGGRVDRRDTGEPRELRVIAEASGAGGLADDLAGDQCTAAFELQQLRRVVGDTNGDLALELIRVACQRAATAHEVSRDPHPNGLRTAREAPRDAIKPDLAVQRASGDPQIGIDVMQQPPQPVLRFASLSDQRLAVTGQQLQVARRVVLDSRWQLRVRERGTRDRERVDAVGLAVRPCALAGPGHELRRDANDPLTVLEQEALEAAADAADVFKRPHALCVDRQRPREQLRVPGRPGHDGQLVNELPARQLHGDGGVRLLVRINADHERHDFPFRLIVDGGGAPADKPQYGQGPRSSQVTLEILGRQRTTEPVLVNLSLFFAGRDDSGTTSQPAAGPRT